MDSQPKLHTEIKTLVQVLRDGDNLLTIPHGWTIEDVAVVPAGTEYEFNHCGVIIRRFVTISRPVEVDEAVQTDKGKS